MIKKTLKTLEELKKNPRFYSERRFFIMMDDDFHIPIELLGTEIEVIEQLGKGLKDKFDKKYYLHETIEYKEKKEIKKDWFIGEDCFK